MLLSDFNYDLPDERIAKYPPKVRGTTRLLVLDKATGTIKDDYYKNLDEYLNPGDVLILNDTRVMRSRLFATLPDGRKRELVVLERHGDEPQKVMYRGKLHDGDRLTVSNDNAFEEHARRRGEYGATEPRNDRPLGRGRALLDGREGAFRESITIAHVLGNGIAEVSSSVPLADLAEKYGAVPLPPYLHRDADENDTKRYQTVWAKHMGSAAAPTASLNMTEELLEKLRQKGVIIKYLTLHVGLGTFLPIRTDKVEDHKMHSEWFHIPEDTLVEIKRITSTGDASAGGPPNQRIRGKADAAGPVRPRIIAVGTTIARTLEYYARTGKTEGEDDIFIYPGFEFKLVDALLTNFHAPKSTVLMLASAFAGWDHLKNAYQHAVDEGYNFLSYGDSMFIC
ncbi:S-adenosylmethionine:tRNA ribosyltransferase-isomerase [Candidatus Saccharibacteria bacterium]|nr:S-adenosylmethionine:tRNA ribosyltransferase-isomerase [Candidatus Saccharibacteria bacterium]